MKKNDATVVSFVTNIYNMYKENIQDKTFNKWSRLVLYGEFLKDYSVFYERNGLSFIEPPEDLANKNFRFNLNEEMSIEYNVAVLEEIISRKEKGYSLTESDCAFLGSCYRSINSIVYVEHALREIGSKAKFLYTGNAKKLFQMFYKYIDVFGPKIEEYNFLNIQRFYENL